MRGKQKHYKGLQGISGQREERSQAERRGRALEGGYNLEREKDKKGGTAFKYNTDQKGPITLAERDEGKGEYEL